MRYINLVFPSFDSICFVDRINKHTRNSEEEVEDEPHQSRHSLPRRQTVPVTDCGILDTDCDDYFSQFDELGNNVGTTNLWYATRSKHVW